MPHQCTNCGRLFADGSKEMLSGCPDCGGNKFQFQPEGSLDDDPATDDGSTTGASRGRSTPSDASTAATTGGPESGGADGLADRVADTGSAVRDWVRGSDDDSASATGNEPTSATNEPTSATNEPTSATNEPTSATSDSAAGPDATSATVDADAVAADAESATGDDSQEDLAQANARSDVVTEDELDRLAPDEADAPPTDADGTVIEPTSDDRPSLDDLREELNDQFESIRIVNPGQYELNLMELYDRDEYIISLQEDGRYVIEVPDAWRDDEE